MGWIDLTHGCINKYIYRYCKYHAFFWDFLQQQSLESLENIETYRNSVFSGCSWVKVKCNGSCQVPFGIAYPSAACYARPALTNWARRPQRGHRGTRCFDWGTFSMAVNGHLSTHLLWFVRMFIVYVLFFSISHYLDFWSLIFCKINERNMKRDVKSLGLFLPPVFED
jgi:hypothetical protein